MKSKDMEVQQLSVNALHPNPWNVNRMGRMMVKKLTAYIKREGLVQPIVVRPHPKRDGEYEILGGYHRWWICKDHLGYEVVPCVVVEGLSDRRAKILSVNLNSMTGETVPSLLSNLLHELEQEMPLDDLEATLPYDTGEIQDVLALMQLPEGFAGDVERQAREQDEDAPTVLTIALDAEQVRVWEEAVKIASDEIGPTRQPMAKTLVLLSTAFIAARREPINSSKEVPHD